MFHNIALSILYFICSCKVIFGYNTYFQGCRKSDNWQCLEGNIVQYECYTSDIRKYTYNSQGDKDNTIIYIWNDGGDINFHNYNYNNNHYSRISYTKENTFIKSLIISNCRNLTLSFKLMKSNNIIPVEEIIVKNVSLLKFYSDAYYSVMPENIKVENLTLENLESQNGLTNVLMTDTNIIGYGKIGTLSVQNLTYLNVGKAGVIISAAVVKANGSNIPSINNDNSQAGSNSQKFSITADNFTFTGNRIGIVQQGGLIVTSPNVIIAGNHFEYLEYGGFESISAGFRNLSFQNGVTTIKIKNNTIQHIESNGLDLGFSTKVHQFHDVIVEENYINCSCKNGEWLRYLKTRNESNTSILKEIYHGKILEKNFCLNKRNCSIDKVAKNYKRLCLDKNLDEICLADLSAAFVPSLDKGEVQGQNKDSEALLQILKNQEKINFQFMDLIRNLSNRMQSLSEKSDSESKGLENFSDSIRSILENITRFQSRIENNTKNNEKLNSQLLTLNKNFFANVMNYLRSRKNDNELRSSFKETQMVTDLFPLRSNLKATQSWQEIPLEPAHLTQTDSLSKTQENPGVNIVLLPNWFLIFSVSLLGVIFSYFVYKKWRNGRLLSDYPRRNSIGLQESIGALTTTTVS